MLASCQPSISMRRSHLSIESLRMRSYCLRLQGHGHRKNATCARRFPYFATCCRTVSLYSKISARLKMAGSDATSCTSAGGGSSFGSFVGVGIIEEQLRFTVAVAVAVGLARNVHLVLELPGFGLAHRADDFPEPLRVDRPAGEDFAPRAAVAPRLSLKVEPHEIAGPEDGPVFLRQLLHAPRRVKPAGGAVRGFTIVQFDGLRLQRFGRLIGPPAASLRGRHL